jgi:lipoprotein-releasing system permease protein
MSFSTFVAQRYLKTSRQSRFFSWIVALSIAGIAIGVAAMIVVLSVINGFEAELRKRFLAANAHIMAYRFPAGLDAPDKWMNIVKEDFKDDISGISFFVHNLTMARQGSLMQSVMIRGIVPKARADVQELRPIINPPEALDVLQDEIDNPQKAALVNPKPIIIGKGLLTLLDCKVGDTIDLVSTDPKSSDQLVPFKVIGVYDSGLKHYDNRIALMSINTARDFFKTRITGLEIGLKRPKDSPAVAARMEQKYNLTIKEWQSFSQNLFEAMEMERAVIAVIVFLVGGVAVFNIWTTLFVSVTQRQKDISILKSLGASNKQILRLFLYQSLLLGVLGGIIGVVLAYGISHGLELLSQYKFIDLPDLYLLASLPVSYDWRVYTVVSTVGTVLCVIAGLFPAYKATRVSPSAGFRGIENAV